MAGLMLVNSKKRGSKGRKYAKKARKHRHYAMAVSRPKKARRYKRNPIASGGVVGGLLDSFKGGAIGAGGAVAGAVVGSFVKPMLPDSMKSGAMGAIVNGAIGFGAGALIGQFTNKRLGADLARGAVTVALYQAAQSMLAGKVPGLGAYDDQLLGEYLNGKDELLGEYLNGDDDDELGAWQTPAPVYADNE